MKTGDHVRMTEGLKARLRGKCGTAGRHLGPLDPDDGYACWGCSTAHADEFGDCIGVVLGPADLGDVETKDPSLVDVPFVLGLRPRVAEACCHRLRGFAAAALPRQVRWQPSGLRYAYQTGDLVLVASA